MSTEKAEKHLEKYSLADRVMKFTVSSATVSLAAQALKTEEERIAKSLSFLTPDGPILVVMAGDTKVDNGKFKAAFNTKAKMIPFDTVEEITGYAAGGVCPFGVNAGVRVYIDESVKRFDIVYPAAGTAQSAVKLTPEELYLASEALAWVDVSRIIE